MKGLHWFRADLRIDDNPALIQGIEASDALFALYIITPKTWLRHHDSPCKIQFILNNLKILSQDLADLGIPLLIKETPNFSRCPKLIASLCQEHNISDVYFNAQYEWDEMQRDKQVTKHLTSMGINTHEVHHEFIFSPTAMLNKQNKPYKVFTPFKKNWYALCEASSHWLCQKAPTKTFPLLLEPPAIPTSIALFKNTIDLSPWPAGEKTANQRLTEFIEHDMLPYHEQRDYPAIPGTSQLSPYLAQGVLSPRQCLKHILKALQLTQPPELLKFPGPATWVGELLWREFYRYILFHFPHIGKHQPFVANTDNLPWRYDKKAFKAWCLGQTGYPLVDAAMRQLNETGWMHNRLRMVTAMFLTKTLFIDWRLGEKYFMEHLIDGDFASNNGGWQWCASTGTDAVPYFRIFNPTTQGKRFDPKGAFIRQYCPELVNLPYQHIHQPQPNAIVDYKLMRAMVIEAFKKLKTPSK